MTEHEKEHIARFSAAFSDLTKTLVRLLEAPAQTMADGFILKGKLDRAVYEFMDFAQCSVMEEQASEPPTNTTPPSAVN